MWTVSGMRLEGRQACAPSPFCFAYLSHPYSLFVYPLRTTQPASQPGACLALHAHHHPYLLPPPRSQLQTPPPALPGLPANARYLRHANKCYDWGTIGWVFSSGQADPSRYKYFIFMNSSVRGPFIPPYARVRLQGLGEAGGTLAAGWNTKYKGGESAGAGCSAKEFGAECSRAGGGLAMCTLRPGWVVQAGPGTWGIGWLCTGNGLL